jgi:hypothetical protein
MTDGNIFSKKNFEANFNITGHSPPMI